MNTMEKSSKKRSVKYLNGDDWTTCSRSTLNVSLFFSRNPIRANGNY